MSCYGVRFGHKMSTSVSKESREIWVVRGAFFNLDLPILMRLFMSTTETLIVWTEPDGTDFALSFQDLDGCGEIWDFIQEVQRHLKGKRTFCFLIARVESGSPTKPYRGSYIIFPSVHPKDVT